MREKFLPVGSIVLLNGGTKKLMITGFCTVSKELPDKVFDYCGCLYPEGIINSNENCVFNHDQIKELLFLGYDSDEEIDFKNRLKLLLNEEEKTADLFQELDEEIEQL